MTIRLHINVRRIRALLGLRGGTAPSSQPPTPDELVDSVTCMLCVRNSAIIGGGTPNERFADEPRWREQAGRIVDELVRIGALLPEFRNRGST